VGRQLPCSHVRRIVAGPCRDGRVWSCFSFHPPDPVLVWFRERERFQLRYSTAIEARRYPCGQATVTRRAWARAYHSSDTTFPTRAQVLADDLIRCRQLRGLTRNDVTELLGPPESSVEEGDFLEYTVGKERDSFFQVDSELLSIEFDRRGVFESAELVQG
jgi:hypothetical protein